MKGGKVWMEVGKGWMKVGKVWMEVGKVQMEVWKEAGKVWIEEVDGEKEEQEVLWSLHLQHRDNVRYLYRKRFQLLVDTQEPVSPQRAPQTKLPPVILISARKLGEIPKSREFKSRAGRWHERGGREGLICRATLHLREDGCRQRAPMTAPTPLSAGTRGPPSPASKRSAGWAAARCLRPFVLIKSVSDVLIRASQPQSQGWRPASGRTLTGACCCHFGANQACRR